MPFDIHALSVLAYANGFTLWHYKAAALPMAAEAGFFDDAADMLATGDMMMVSGPEGGRLLCVAVGAGRVTASALG